MLTKSIDEAKLINKYHKQFLRMDYTGAMETVGVMKNYYIPGARYYEILLLFELNKFNKIRAMLLGKELNWKERELYIASLAELQLFDEVEKALDNEPRLDSNSPQMNSDSRPISEYAFRYICYLLEKNGYPFTKELVPSCEENASLENAYFHTRYYWTIFYDLIDIYTSYEELLLMKAASVSKKTIKQTKNRILSKLSLMQKCNKDSYLGDDPYFTEIEKAIKQDNTIGLHYFLWFPIRYLGHANADGSPQMEHTFSDIYSIEKYIRFCIRLDDPSVELNTFFEYLMDLEKEAEKGNEYVIDLLKELYLQTHYYSRYLTGDSDDSSIAKFFRKVVQRHSPHTIREIELHETDASISDQLSVKGKIAYKAALWQFDNALNGNLGTMDAGMLCLSYMRILELELNQKVYLPLKAYQQQIEDKYHSILKQIKKTSIDPEPTLSKRWEAIFLLNNDGIELGKLHNFLVLFETDPGEYEAPLREFITELFRNHILNEHGMNCLLSGKLAKMIDYRAREKYRNPPAHTRYVNVDTAFECRQYVEKNLKEIFKCIK